MTNNISERAWLITWENATTGELSIGLILPGDTEPERVKWLVQELYIAQTASDPEKLDSALGRRVADPAKVARSKSGNIQITCGHNPYLRARLVEGLSHKPDEDGAETLVWTELD